MSEGRRLWFGKDWQEVPRQQDRRSVGVPPYRVFAGIGVHYVGITSTAPAIAEATITFGRRIARKLRDRRQGGGSTSSAAYCYAVWLRHVIALHEAGLLREVPDAVAELGPGDSIGVGLAAILSGVQTYAAVDAVPFVRGDPLELIDTLAGMVRERARVPDVPEMPIGYPPIGSPAFPGSILDPEAASAQRVVAIRERPDEFVHYVAPWSDTRVIPPASIDLVMSQAVMEHVTDIEAAYAAMATWLRPGGLMSHQVDFRSHGTALAWNGHWRYSHRLWRMANLRKSGINRLPLSEHLRAMEASGFAVVARSAQTDDTGIGRRQVHSDWEHLTSADLRTSSAWIAARRT